MSRSALSVFILLTTVFARPQTPLNELPACAQQAGLTAIDATGCDLRDTHCICISEPFLETLRTYIEQNCDVADQSTALAFGQKFCLEASVTISAVVTGATNMHGATPVVVTPTTTAMTGTATSTMTMSSDADVAPATTSAAEMSRSTSSEGSMFTGAAARVGIEVMAALAGAAGVMAVF